MFLLYCSSKSGSRNEAACAVLGLVARHGDAGARGRSVAARPMKRTEERPLAHGVQCVLLPSLPLSHSRGLTERRAFAGAATGIRGGRVALWEGFFGRGRGSCDQPAAHHRGLAAGPAAGPSGATCTPSSAAIWRGPRCGSRSTWAALRGAEIGACLACRPEFWHAACACPLLAWLAQSARDDLI